MIVPEDEAIPFATIAAHLRFDSATLLTVQCVKDDGELGPVHRYQPMEDITIGREADSAIRIRHPDVCAHHAKIYRNSTDGLLHIKTIHDGFAFTLPSGADATDVPLLPGTSFKLGPAMVACPGTPPKVRIACPRCRGLLVHLPFDARFCSRCGLELPAYCPPWSLGQLTTASAVQHHPSLIAYLNALFNLGMRAESQDADEAQAVRYFEKAAKLGNAAAKARLEARESCA